MKLEPFVLDYETFWSTEHTLTKMSPMAYVMHPETEIISVAIRQPGKPSEVIFGENNVRDRLLAEDWSNKLLLAHNNEGFDALISSFRFGIRPKMWGCTLAMARPHHAKTAGGSLKALCLHYADELRAMGIDPVKDNTALLNTKGRHLKDFTPAEIEHMARYNGTDADQCYGLFSILAKKTSKDEMRLIDITIRALVEPQFEIDRDLLVSTLANERGRKFGVLLDLSQKLGLDTFASEEEAVANVTKTLGSAAKFGQLLNTLGVEVPMKTSPTTGKPAPALAKTDEAFIALQDHDDPMVAMAAAARLGVKSTLLETRIEAFLAASDAVGGKLPVPLKYYGADTTGRWSGWAYNCFLGDTEVLTEQGWVRFDAWKGEPIAQWWPNGSITMEPNPGTLVKPYAGPVVDIESRCVSSTMTPDHRLVSCPTTKAGLKEHTAGWVAEHSGLDNIPAAGVWAGASDSVMTPELVRLAVAFSADGCVVGDTIQVGLRRERKITRMRELLAATNVPHQVRETPPQKGTREHITP